METMVVGKAAEGSIRTVFSISQRFSGYILSSVALNNLNQYGPLSGSMDVRGTWKSQEYCCESAKPSALTLLLLCS